MDLHKTVYPFYTTEKLPHESTRSVCICLKSYVVKNKFHHVWPPQKNFWKNPLVTPQGIIPSNTHAHKRVKWHHFCEKLWKKNINEILPNFCNIFFIERFTLSLDPILVVLIKLTIFRQKSGGATPTHLIPRKVWGESADGSGQGQTSSL